MHRLGARRRLELALLVLLVPVWQVTGEPSRQLSGRASSQPSGQQQPQQAQQAPPRQPEFSAPIGNVTAVLGRDVRLVCSVENLGQHQVAWLKEESKTILSIDTNIIITNYRIFLIPDEEKRKWVLHIKDVQESDRGFYQCQVNTSPTRSTSGYLDVAVPPAIVEHQSSQVLEVPEHSNASLQCKATGHPRPSVSWRRDDGAPIRLSGRARPAEPSEPAGASVSLLNDVKSDKLSLSDVDRTMAGIYVCSASNGVPAPATKSIPVYVKFAPKASIVNKYVSISLNEPLEVDCLIEAFPKAHSYWSRRGQSAGPGPGSGLAPARASWLERHATWRRAHQTPGAPQLERAPPGGVAEAPGDEASPGEEAEEGAKQRGAFLTVKQTALNAFTYKLSLTIARVRPEDYGEYACIASNSLGSAESRVVVTRVDKLQAQESTSAQVSSDFSVDEADAAAGRVQAAGSGARRGSPAPTNRVVVYDENYLQAIKTRQNGQSNPLKTLNKLKLRQNGPARSSARARPSVAAFGLPMAGALALALGLVLAQPGQPTTSAARRT